MDTMDSLDNQRLHDEASSLADDALLNSFFAATQQPLTDDGFTERVMAHLPPRAANLRRWSMALNIVAAVAIVTMVIFLATSYGVADNIERCATYTLETLVCHVVYFDADALLVRLMLFLHRLPSMLPSATQLIAIVATFILLTTLGIKQHIKHI